MRAMTASRAIANLAALCLRHCPLVAQAHRIATVRDGTVSLSTYRALELVRSAAKHIDDDAAKVPNLWGELGVIHGFVRTPAGR